MALRAGGGQHKFQRNVTYLLYEHKPIRENEVHQRADCDGGHVCRISVQPCSAYEHEHQNQVSSQAHRPRRQVEAKQHGHDSRRAPVGPGPLSMPYEVMNHARFDGDCGRGQVVHLYCAQQEVEHDCLHDYSRSPDRAEAYPAINERSSALQIIPSRSGHDLFLMHALEETRQPSSHLS